MHAGGGVGFVPALRDDAPCRLLGELLDLDAVWIVAPGPTGREVTARWEREAAPPHRFGEARLAAVVQDVDRRGDPDPRRPLCGAGRSARRRRPRRRPSRGVGALAARAFRPDELRAAELVAAGAAAEAGPAQTACGRRLHTRPRSPAGADGPPAIAHLPAGVRPVGGRDRPRGRRRARPPGPVSRPAVLSPLGGRATRSLSRGRRTARIATPTNWPRVGDTRGGTRRGRRPGAADSRRVRHGRPDAGRRGRRRRHRRLGAARRRVRRARPRACSRSSRRTPPSRAGTCASTRRCERPPRSPRRCSSSVPRSRPR